MTNEDLIAQIKLAGCGSYHDVQMLEDGTIICLGDLMFTRAIHMDMNLNGYGRRFCFDDHLLAETEYAKITTGNDEPTGWIARRGR